MKNNKKKILAIVLVILVVLLGGASIYVATQLSTKQAVAPNAPTSKPAASGLAQIGESCGTGTSCDTGLTCTNSICTTSNVTTWVGSDACTVTGTATAVVVANATLTGSKTAYKNASGNSAGSYTLSTEMSTVSKSQEYVYLITLKNTSDVTATGVTIKDSLVDIPNLTFVDTVNDCTWSSTDKMLTCNTTIDAGATKTFAFRVTAAAGIANGDTITNTANVTYNGDSLSLKKDLTVSSVVGCNNTCTSDDECSTGLTCDTTSNKCRLVTCLTETDCTCATAVTGTVVKTVYVTATKTITPTKIATAAATPTTLPETGVLDIPGVAAFGGGLFLAVVGILLAL